MRYGSLLVLPLGALRTTTAQAWAPRELAPECALALLGTGAEMGALEACAAGIGGAGRYGKTASAAQRKPCSSAVAWERIYPR